MSRKKEEYYEVENFYFNNLKDKSVFTEEEKNSTIYCVEHGKRRIRIPEDNN